MSEITLREKVYDQLRELIIYGDLKPGEYLTERALAEKMQVSRTPIRSAIERIEADGLVSYTPNRGMIIAEVSINKVVDFFELRSIIESHVVRKLASRSKSSEDFKWLQDNLESQKVFVEQKDYISFTKADSEFHRKLVQTYGNGEMIQIMEKLQDRLFQLALNVLKKDNERICASYEDHRSILNYIMEGNGEEAAQKIVQHLEFGKQILIL